MANKVEKVMCGASDLGIACGGALALGGVAQNSDLQSNATQGGSRKMNNMKKIMCALAAVAAGVAMADVQSANIVGYANTGKIETGYMMKTILFEGVGEEGLDIQTIIPMGENIPGDGQVLLMVYDKDRKNTETYDWELDEVTEGGFDGWAFNGSKANKKIMSGTGVFVKAPCDLQLQMAGQVKTTKTIFTAPVEGYYIVGNSTPVEIDIQKIIPKADNLPGDGQVLLMVYDKNRKNTETYDWELDEVTEGGFDGWAFNGSKSNRKLQPGEAVFLKAPCAMTLEFPALELAK